MAVALAAVAAALTFPHGLVELATPSARVTLRVDIANTDARRAQGLMGRTRLARRVGMLFTFPNAVRGGFWMKETLIPLSIAFADEHGQILRVLDMTPCRSDPCRIYDPRVAYSSALEVNRGAFRRWGVRAGDWLVRLK